MRDPAFLFYDGDAARDVSHMTRLERGAYFDLIQAQRKFGGYTVEQIRKILGKDFEEVWPAVELILSISENGKYFIEWVQVSIENRKDHAEKQRKRIQDYWDKKKIEENKEDIIIPRNNHGITTVIPLVNENTIENENAIVVKVKGGTGGKRKTVFIPPELIDVENYFIDNGFSKTLAQKFFKSYSVANWVNSKGKPVLNWKQTAINVWFTEENKINSNGTGQQKQQFSSNSNSGVSDDYKRSILERLGVTGSTENM